MKRWIWKGKIWAILLLFTISSTASVLLPATANAAAQGVSVNTKLMSEIEARLYRDALVACLNQATFGEKQDFLGFTWEATQDNIANGKWFTDGAASKRYVVSGPTLSPDTVKLCSDASFIKTAVNALGWTDLIQAACDLGMKRTGSGGCMSEVSNFKIGDAVDGGKTTDIINNKRFGSNPNMSPAMTYLYSARAMELGCKATPIALVSEATADQKATGEGSNGWTAKVVNQDGSVSEVIYAAQKPRNQDIPIRADYTKAKFPMGTSWEGKSITDDILGYIASSCINLVTTMNDNAAAYATYQNNNKDTAQPPADPPTDGPGAGPVDSKPTCTIGGVGWIVCPVTTFMANIADGASNILKDFLMVPAAKIFAPGSNANIYWAQVRNYANILFVIAFIIIILSQVTSIGISNYGIKKLLPKLILVAVLVNVSFIITAIAVDLSNVLGYSAGRLLSVDMNNVGVAQDPGGVFSGQNMFANIAGGLLVGSVAGVVIGTMWHFFLAAFLGAILSVIISGIVIIFLLAIRQALVILLVVLSPLALVALLLPNTEKLFKKWLGLFKSMLLIFPIISLLFGAGTLASGILMSTTDNILVKIVAAALPFVMMLAAFTVFKKALEAIDGVGAFANGMRNGLNRLARDPVKKLASNRDRATREHAKQKFLAGQIPGLGRLGSAVNNRSKRWQVRTAAAQAAAQANASQYQRNNLQTYTNRTAAANLQNQVAQQAIKNQGLAHTLGNNIDLHQEEGRLKEEERKLNEEKKTVEVDASRLERSMADVAEQIRKNAEAGSKNQSEANLQTNHPNLITQEGELEEVARRQAATRKTIKLGDANVRNEFMQANEAELETKELETQRNSDWEERVSNSTALTQRKINIAAQEARGEAAQEQVKASIKRTFEDAVNPNTATTLTVNRGDGTATDLTQVLHAKQDAEAVVKAADAGIKAHETTRAATDVNLQALDNERRDSEATIKEFETMRDSDYSARVAADAGLTEQRARIEGQQMRGKGAEKVIDAAVKDTVALGTMNIADGTGATMDIRQIRETTQDAEADIVASEAAIESQDTSRAATDQNLIDLRHDTQRLKTEAKLNEAAIKTQDTQFAAADTTMQGLRQATIREEAIGNQAETEMKVQDTNYRATDEEMMAIRQNTQMAEAEVKTEEAVIGSQDAQFAAEDGEMQRQRESTQIAEAEKSQYDATVAADKEEFTATDSTMIGLTNETRAQQDRASSAKRVQNTSYADELIQEGSSLATTAGGIAPGGEQRVKAQAQSTIAREYDEAVKNIRTTFSIDERSDNDKRAQYLDIINNPESHPTEEVEAATAEYMRYVGEDDIMDQVTASRLISDPARRKAVQQGILAGMKDSGKALAYIPGPVRGAMERGQYTDSMIYRPGQGPQLPNDEKGFMLFNAREGKTTAEVFAGFSKPEREKTIEALVEYSEHLDAKAITTLQSTINEVLNPLLKPGLKVEQRVVDNAYELIERLAAEGVDLKVPTGDNIRRRSGT